jgi:ABC-type multidrug transport system ATPase subunit
LDAAGRSQFLHLLAQVKAAGKTILFTSHRLEEIEQLADQVMVMERGVLKLTCAGDQLAACLGLRTTMKCNYSGNKLANKLNGNANEKLMRS